MPKLHSPEPSGDDGDGRYRRACRRCPQQRHLCVVLDDWSGYSIYKLDVDGMIFAMDYSKEDNDAPVLVYGTATGGLAVGPFTPAELRNRPELVPAGDRLYALDRGFGRDHFKVLAPHGRRGWAWSSLRDAPFDTGRATACHAAHPDGRTVFFSARDNRGTFSFDAGAGKWAWHGDWMLPFEGQAHYDAEVDAWVGLCRRAASPGRVCSCDVVAPAGEGDGEGDPTRADRPPPSWKLAEERLASRGSRDVELAHMGNGRFCLVEYRNRRGVPRDVLDEDCLLYATTFRLRYDKDGALRAMQRRARCYAVRKKSNTFHWRAFGV
ncbi:hypothetical protein BAE44_0005245 [Dichanthelium oligosanthes]|uniref:Uncharacterized protein n=1 Tax=Dichanthelium oligosanthes TaxID=888268 RepID=A0A1E5W8M1_9POAL|nr:hypothetical protein BAE44_0005245 [Dichanthelium oligosanthes]